MTTTKNRTDTDNYEVQLDGQHVTVESCRKTWGGYVNLMNRLEKQYGRLRCTDETGTTMTTTDGRTVTLRKVSVL